MKRGSSADENESWGGWTPAMLVVPQPKRMPTTGVPEPIEPPRKLHKLCGLVPKQPSYPPPHYKLNQRPAEPVDEPKPKTYSSRRFDPSHVAIRVEPKPGFVKKIHVPKEIPPPAKAGARVKSEDKKEVEMVEKEVAEPVLSVRSAQMGLENA